MSTADDPSGEPSGPDSPPRTVALPEFTAGIDTDGPPRISPGRLVVAALSAGLVVALLGWGLPWATGASWPQILDTLTSVHPAALLALLGLGLGAVALEALTVRAAVPHGRYLPALQAHSVSSGMSLALPGGSLLGLAALAWILRRSGLAIPVIITGVLAASLVEMAITSVLLPLVGLGAYVVSAQLAPIDVELPHALWAALLALLGAVLALALTALGLRRGLLTGLLEQGRDLLPEGTAEQVLAQRDALRS